MSRIHFPLASLFILFMISCHGPTPAGPDATPAAAAASPAFYTCPMHPSVQQAGPGQCPICGMNLVPVAAADATEGAVVVDEGRRAALGIRTAPVERRALRRALKAAGAVEAAEDRVTEVSLRVDGFVRGLDADQTGQAVRRGQRLLSLYSPAIYAAEQELLTAARAGVGLEAAKARLRLWELPEAWIQGVIDRGAPDELTPILAPASGVLLEKRVVDGAAVRAGEALFRLAALDRVWVQAEVDEADLPYVQRGQTAQVQFPFSPGQTWQGEVTFLAPTLDPRTRTRAARVELDNADGALLPGMYADVTLDLDLGERLVVPTEALIVTGARRIAFVDRGGGRLVPVEVQPGASGQGFTEVRAGLSEGDQVVASGNFLVASESRIGAALSLWGEAPAEAPHAH